MKARKARKARSVEALTAIFRCKGATMRHRADRRAVERQTAWKKEVWS